MFPKTGHFNKGRRREGKWLGHCSPVLKKGVQRGSKEVPFHNNIIGNFMVNQYRIEKNLQHPENLEGFSVISVITSEVNIVAKKKQS